SEWNEVFRVQTRFPQATEVKIMKEYEKPTMEVITLLGNVITASCDFQGNEEPVCETEDD
ncbi:MAG: hypothetical protein IIZ82_06025, partial [Clostridia bacterium]|nr:hypothetical protein [Clostridia bacterium]